MKLKKPAVPAFLFGNGLVTPDAVAWLRALLRIASGRESRLRPMDRRRWRSSLDLPGNGFAQLKPESLNDKEIITSLDPVAIRPKTFTEGFKPPPTALEPHKRLLELAISTHVVNLYTCQNGFQANLLGKIHRFLAMLPWVGIRRSNHRPSCKDKGS